MRLNATAGSLLGFLHEGPMTGWDLVATAQERVGDFWSLTQSQVYRELGAMARAGLIEAGERGQRDRRPYTLTDDGRAAFTAWMQAGPGAETIRFPLLLTVLFGRHLDAERREEILAAHRRTHRERLTAYERAAEQGEVGDAFGEATLQFGIRYERAVLDWFDALPDLLPPKGRARKQEREHEKAASPANNARQARSVTSAG